MPTPTSNSVKKMSRNPETPKGLKVLVRVLNLNRNAPDKTPSPIQKAASISQSNQLPGSKTKPSPLFNKKPLNLGKTTPTKKRGETTNGVKRAM